MAQNAPPKSARAEGDEEEIEHITRSEFDDLMGDMEERITAATTTATEAFGSAIKGEFVTLIKKHDTICTKRFSSTEASIKAVNDNADKQRADMDNMLANIDFSTLMGSNWCFKMK